MRAKLSILSVVVLGLITGLCFHLVRSNTDSKAKQSAEEKLQGLFSATWGLIEGDSHEAVRNAADITYKYRGEFLTFMRDQEWLENFLELKLNGLPEEKRPDVALIMVRERVLASHVPQELLPKSKMEGMSPGMTNRNVDLVVARQVFESELKKKEGAPAGALVPAGWENPEITVGEVKKGKYFARDLPLAVAAPIVLILDSEKQPSTSGTPRRVGALVLAWTKKIDASDAGEVAENLAGDIELRNKHFWAAYKSDRGRLRGVLLMAEEEFETAGRSPTFMALVDRRGVVLHRDKDTRQFVGESLADNYISLNTVLSTGTARSDIWSAREMASIGLSEEKEGQRKAETGTRTSLIRIGMAPFIGDDGRVMGGICVGWSLSDRRATEIGQDLGAGVIFLEGDNYVASSRGLPMVGGETISKLMARRVERKTFGKADGAVEFDGLQAVPVELGGGRYFGAAGVMAGSEREGMHTFLLLVSMDDLKSPFRTFSWALLLLGGLAVVIVLLMVFLMSKHFLKPIDEIYNGVNEVMSGDLDYSFGVYSRETEGLSYALNGLLSKLLGRPEPDDEEEPGEETDTPPEATVELGPLPDTTVSAAQEPAASLGRETDDSHYKRVFEEYVSALDKFGEDISAFTFDVFRQRVDVNVRVIKDRYECDKVRFVVGADSEGKPVLNPLPIKG